MTAAEVGVFKILIRHPQLTRVLQDNMLISEEAVNVYMIIKDESIFDGRVSKGVFNSLLKQKDIKIDISILNEIFQDIDTVPADREVAKRDLLAQIKLLMRDTDKHTLLASLDKAKRLTQNGKLDEAEKVIRGIKLRSPDDIVPSKQLMLESVIHTSGFKTGIHEIDKNKLAFVKGEITSIVSDSGAMKTYFTMWFMIQCLIQNPTFIGLFFQKEMAVRDMGRRLLSWMIKESSIEILKRSVDNYDEAVIHYKERIDEQLSDTMSDLIKRILFVPNNRFSTPIDMLRYIESYNADIWVLDYMTQIKSDINAQSYNIGVMESVNALKQYVADTESHGIIINQTSKDTKDTKDKRITNPSDIEWSKNIENVSANIYSLFYPWKHRDSFIKAPFMEGLRATPYEKSYYYLLDLKSRHIDSSIPSILKSNPDHATFEEFDTDNYARAENWYNEYVKYVKDPRDRK